MAARNTDKWIGADDARIRTLHLEGLGAVAASNLAACVANTSPS
jgi:hypothetical protein